MLLAIVVEQTEIAEQVLGGIKHVCMNTETFCAVCNYRFPLVTRDSRGFFYFNNILIKCDENLKFTHFVYHGFFGKSFFTKIDFVKKKRTIDLESIKEKEVRP